MVGRNYTPYSEWRNTALTTAFIIKNRDEYIKVEYDTNGSINYNNRIERCRWYITLQNEELFERIPENDEMLYETISNCVEEWDNPHIEFQNDRILEIETHNEPIYEWLNELVINRTALLPQ